MGSRVTVQNCPCKRLCCVAGLTQLACVNRDSDGREHSLAILKKTGEKERETRACSFNFSLCNGSDRFSGLSCGTDSR